VAQPTSIKELRRVTAFVANPSVKQAVLGRAREQVGPDIRW
jgi:hypothetical protein